MYFLGQFEKSLLTWTKADRLRRNNKEVFDKKDAKYAKETKETDLI